LSHPRIKILATVIDVPLKVLACTPLGFSPYSEKQLREILVSRAKFAGFCKYNHLPLDVHAPAEVEVGVVRPTVDFSNDIEVFSAVLVVVLPQFLLKSRHVRDLWETVMSLWGYMFYNSNPALYICETSSQDTTAPSSSAAAAAVPVTKAANTNSSSSGCNKGRFLIDFKAVKAAAQEMLLMPATHILKVQLPSRRRGVRGRIVDPEQNSRLARLEKWNSRSGTIDSSTGHKGFRAELLQAIPEDVTSIMDTNLCELKLIENWVTVSLIRSIPASIPPLIRSISAYLPPLIRSIPAMGDTHQQNIIHTEYNINMALPIVLQ
jgi:Tfp pilus assembly protein PilV